MKDMYDEKGLLRPEFDLSYKQRKEMLINNDSIDKPIDNRTNCGKGLIFLTCDGKECETMEQVMRYNQVYYNNMMNNLKFNNYDHYIENKRRR